MTASDAQPSPQPTAAILIIGNEILSGRTQDANLAFLGKELSEMGIRLVEARVIPDIEETIVGTVNEMRARCSYVFTTGGIGPTHDDITSGCVAKAFGVALHRHPEAVRLLEDHYRGLDVELNEARLRMAEVPVGATLVNNPISKAPGFRYENVYVFAGIPSVMRAMFEQVRHELQGGDPLLSKTVSCGLGEGTIAMRLETVQEAHPALDIGSYPYFRDGRFGTSLVVRGTDPADIDAAATEIRQAIKDLGATPIEGEV
ncbi:MAG: molybdopterin-binding protein [Alphaproteobacteria bacterium]|nr:molybdopterin-binding protein [Alphaproteobacteria bacterium]